jgi:ATP-binding cassette subfamily B protein
MTFSSPTLIKQHDITDCGAACLASVSAHYKRYLPIARIRQYASTDKRGSNVLGLVEAADKMGFQTKGVKATKESLFKVPKPTIAHVIIGEQKLQHYVVIYEVSEKQVRYMDPADGKMHKESHEDFAKIWTWVLLLLLPKEEFEQSNEKVSVYARFWFLLRPHCSVLMQALVGAIFYTILGLATSIYVQKLVDYVIPDANRNLMNLMSVVMIVLLLLQLLIGTMKSIFTLKTGQQIDAQLILGYYKHLLRLPQQFFDTMRVGEIISRVNDAVKIRVFINEVAISLAVNVFIVLFSFALMFTYYWKLALVTLAIIPFYILIYFTINQINKKVQRKLMENAADLEAQLVESLNAMSTVKRFGLETHANLKTEDRFIKLLRTIYQSGTSGIYAGTASEFVSRIFTIIILWAGAYFVLDNVITTGELLSFYAIIGYFTSPASSLIGINRTIQDALIAADRLFEIIDLEREETTNKVQLTPDLIGDIEFRNVSFRYGARVQVFDNLSLIFPKGKITAIVGESGSGKSTLMSLLQNIYPLQSGSIHIGNYNIRHISHASLRQTVSVVPQKIDLFSGSVIENIAIGDFEPDMQRIIQICQLTGIMELIEQLPNGFETKIGERGANLSGGQQQRIAIARALYRKPEILILDEATSSLDSISEKYIQNTIKQLRKQEKTIILIAHRLSTVKNADKIIVLEKGKVTEEGTHQELLSREGKYYHLWQEQFAPVADLMMN